MLIKIHNEEPRNLPYKHHLIGNKENMTITYYSELALFLQSIDLANKTLTITYNPPDGKSKTLEMPLEPDIGELEPMDVSLHQSPSNAYKMGSEVNEWFSSCFGYEVILAYLGPHQRPVLGNLSPNAIQNKPPKPQSWLSSVTVSIPNILTSKSTDAPSLSFADCASYLVVTEESLQDVSSRLSGQEMDITKFRPNIVLSGASKAYEEDYWGALTIKSSSEKEKEKENQQQRESQLILTANCGRCVSINVDYSTGKAAKGDEGSVLKKLMKDRRVDGGNKYSPIFGRYGFMEEAGVGMTVAVGDEVTVSRINEERTTFGESFYLGLRACHC